MFFAMDGIWKSQGHVFGWCYCEWLPVLHKKLGMKKNMLMWLKSLGDLGGTKNFCKILGDF
jgi:hypothetical protein